MNYLSGDLKVVGTRPIRPDGVEKVTGRAIFAADTRASGMLWGKILRSPHAHARIVSIDTSKAEALTGVKAVVTSKDFPEIASEEAFVGEGPMNFRDLADNVMARGKVLYEGHALDAEQLGRVGADHEVTLRRGMDRDLSIRGVRRKAGMRLNVGLMHRLGGVATFDDDLGVLEAGVDVALLEGHDLRDVGRLGRLRVHTGGEQDRKSVV